MRWLSITAHNFPEGLATFFATLENPGVGMPLAFAIAIHNIPEGIAIAVPVYFATNNKMYTQLNLQRWNGKAWDLVGGLIDVLVTDEPAAQALLDRWADDGGRNR